MNKKEFLYASVLKVTREDTLNDIRRHFMQMTANGFNTVVIWPACECQITDVVRPEVFGPGRQDSGVLIKLLNAQERLGIQVHPTPAFSQVHFGTNYGKTECWHILDTAPGASIYIGFKEEISKEKWMDLYNRQDIPGMLSCLHKFEVQKGDKLFVPYGCNAFTVIDAEVLVCHPPRITLEK